MAAGAPSAHDRGGAIDTHERGRAIYNFRCYFCHGYSGDAKTLATTYLEPKPRDFTASTLTRAQIAEALRHGRPGTAMASFEGILDAADIAAVAAFVEREFVQERRVNTRYHTEANGWPGHERHAAAFPYATGEVALDAPVETLTPPLQAGRRLFVTTCISCHDRARVSDPGPDWSARPVSFPRMGFVPGQPNLAPPPDAVSSASVYARHEVPPDTGGLGAAERRGAALFQANCAFCHGADGSGKNWIGRFMEPPARDLTRYTLQTMPLAVLEQRIREGLPGTSMPAWQHVLTAAQVRDLARFVAGVLYGRAPVPDEPATAAAAPIAPRR
jgi:cytochrome c oxidase cbb3-type subunit 3